MSWIHVCYFWLLQATDDVAEGIIEEDYALFYEIWQEFDPEATTYISYDNVAELLDVLEPPLQVIEDKCIWNSLWMIYYTTELWRDINNYFFLDRYAE